MTEVNMHIGVIKFSIRLPENQSLKGKRRTIQSLCQKIRNHFSVSIAEVAQNDDLKTAVIGVTCVSNSYQVIQKMIAAILAYLQEHVGNFVLEEFTQEIISGF
jgi:uncharacterized protein